MADYPRVIDEFYRVMFEQHDAEAVANLYAEDAVYHDPATGELRGREAIKQAYGGILKAFPDVSGEMLSAFGSGDIAASEVKIRGTHTGPLELGPGNVAPPTGKSFELACGWFARITPDGLIAEDRTYYDVNSWLAQLGLMEQLGPTTAAA